MKTLFLILITTQVFANSPSPIDEAKSLFVVGKRKEAIEILNKAITKAKSKKEIQTLTQKRKLFFNQFYTAESFQHYQSAKIFSHTERFNDCVSEIDKASVGDVDNRLILELKGLCQKSQNQLSQAEKTLTLYFQLDPEDQSAIIELAEIHVLQKNYELAGPLLLKAEDSERKVLLQAKVHVEKSELKEAIDLLREDQEKNFEHILVLYELGVLYQKKQGSDWLARKYFALFISRCKRMSPEELKEKKLEKLFLQAQEILTELDKKLAV